MSDNLREKKCLHEFTIFARIFLFYLSKIFESTFFDSYKGCGCIQLSLFCEVFYVFLFIFLFFFIFFSQFNILFLIRKMYLFPKNRWFCQEVIHYYNRQYIDNINYTACNHAMRGWWEKNRCYRHQKKLKE